MSDLSKRWFIVYETMTRNSQGFVNPRGIWRNDTYQGEHPITKIDRANKEDKYNFCILVYYREITEEENAYLEASNKQLEGGM